MECFSAQGNVRTGSLESLKHCPKINEKPNTRANVHEENHIPLITGNIVENSKFFNLLCIYSQKRSILLCDNLTDSIVQTGS